MTFSGFLRTFFDPLTLDMPDVCRVTRERNDDGKAPDQAQPQTAREEGKPEGQNWFPSSK